MKKTFLITVLASFFLFFVFAQNAFAQTPQKFSTGITNPVIDQTLGGNADNANNGTIFVSYFVTVWRALIVVGGLAVLFNFVNGAIEWITAGGQQDKVGHGRQKMTNSIVGMVILAGSFILINYISDLFGLNLLKFTFPTPGGSANTQQTNPQNPIFPADFPNYNPGRLDSQQKGTL